MQLKDSDFNHYGISDSYAKKYKKSFYIFHRLLLFIVSGGLKDSDFNHYGISDSFDFNKNFRGLKDIIFIIFVTFKIFITFE